MILIIQVNQTFCDNEYKTNQDIPIKVLDEIGKFSTLISGMSAVTDQYNVLFEYILPLARKFDKDNKDSIERSSVHQWNIALNQMYECSKEGIRYILKVLRTFPENGTIKMSEFAELYSNSTRFNAQCALQCSNVTEILRPDVISCLYNITPALAELFLPKSSNITLCTKNFVKSFEETLSEPPIFYEYTDIACKILEIERSKLKSKVLEMLYELPNVIHDMHTMQISLSRGHYEGCMRGFLRLTSLFGGYTEKSIDPKSCPCSRLDHFQRL